MVCGERAKKQEQAVEGDGEHQEQTVCVCVSVEQSVVDARRDTHSTAFEHAMAPISHNNNKDTRSNIVNKVLLLL